MRKKRAELEQAVIAAARNLNGVRLEYGRTGEPETYDQFIAALAALGDAIVALDNYEAAELTGEGAPWARGSETSRTAASLAVPVQASAREQIIAFLAAVPPMAHPGYTDEQLERRLNRPHQTVSSARNWLVNNGWVRDSGERRPTRNGRMAVVWQLTPAGLAKLKEQ